MIFFLCCDILRDNDDLKDKKRHDDIPCADGPKLFLSPTSFLTLVGSLHGLLPL